MDLLRRKSTSKSRHGPGSDPRPGLSCGSEARKISKDCGPEPKRKGKDGPGPSCLSVKSDQSKDAVIVFQRDSERPGPRCESVKSDRSKDWGEHFKSDPPEDLRKGKDGPGPSCLSVKSDQSKDAVIVFQRDSETPGPRCESVKSDQSKDAVIVFQREGKDGPGPSCLSVKSDSSKEAVILFQRDSETPGPRCESVKSDWSKDWGEHFKSDSPEDLRFGTGDGVCGETQAQLDTVFTCLEKQILPFVKEQLQSLHRLLLSEHTESPSESEEGQRSREAVLNITLHFLREMKQEQLAEQLRNRYIAPVCRELKSHLQQRFNLVFEGVAKAGNSASLQEIYTELYITEGGASEVHQEHEFRHMETASRKAAERSVACEDIFKQLSENEKPIRTVLTKGVAGIGKTVLTQKFSLDWAEGRANQDVQLLFPFTFRELNVLRGSEFSLMELLQHFFSQTKGLSSFDDHQLLFILDGLDECRLPLDFSRTRVLTDPTERASVQELLVNLFRGSLLPSARLWITTRPAAATQIPAWCVSMVTEVRGFTDLHKEQYFMKRFKDEQQATAIISHIKKSRILYSMCYNPVFCWILSTVIQTLLELLEEPELPNTLTEMYVHFLVVQAKVKNIKYHEGSGADLHWTPETREMVKTLGKLAFEQLQKGNLIFYESDLSECGLDAEEIARYSGVFTQVFREEPGLYQEKVYCFIHLSVQEFLAALHVHETFFSSGENLLSPPHSSGSPESESSSDLTGNTQDRFKISVPDAANNRSAGRRDSFSSYQSSLLSDVDVTIRPFDVLDAVGPSAGKWGRRDSFLSYYAAILSAGDMTERPSDVDKTEFPSDVLDAVRPSAGKRDSFSSGTYRALLSALDRSRRPSDVLDAKGPSAGKGGRRNYSSLLSYYEAIFSPGNMTKRPSDVDEFPSDVLDAVRPSAGKRDSFHSLLHKSKRASAGKRGRRASLPSGLNQGLRSCATKVFSAVRQVFRPSAVDQTLQEPPFQSPISSSQPLQAFQNHQPTSEETFYSCAVNQALQSPNGHLDLFLRFLLGLSLPTNQTLLQGLLIHTSSPSQNNDGTIEYIKQRLNKTGLPAEKRLNLLHCLNELNDRSLLENIQRYMRRGAFSDGNRSPAEWSALSFLLLSSDSDLEQFDLRKYCPTERGLLNLLPVIKASTKAILSSCEVSPVGCEQLVSVFSSSSLTHLDLSNNDLQDLGLKLLCEGLKSASCRLHTFSLSNCGVSPLHCGPLASVLSSSSLTHLDLSNNNLQDYGVCLLCRGLKSASCRLHTFSLSSCGVSALSCGPLASVLSSSSLTHLDLSNNDLQDSGVQLLCEGLKSAPCRLHTFRLSGCQISPVGGASLAAALTSAPSCHLRELDVSYNHPGASAEQLTALQAPQGPLVSLRLDPAGGQFMVAGPRKYAFEFSLDPDTAHESLLLSEDKRTVTCKEEEEQRPNNKFTQYNQVQSSAGLRGRCYWELDWRGNVIITVSNSEQSLSEDKDHSWILRIYKEQFFVHHKNKRTRLSARRAVSGRVGVFLNSDAGTLSFYRVFCGDLIHLHTFNTSSSSFTEPLFPGFGLSPGSAVSLV